MIVRDTGHLMEKKIDISQSCYLLDDLNQRSADFFYKEPHSKYIRHCGLFVLDAAVRLCGCGVKGVLGSRSVRLNPNKTFSSRFCWSDLACGSQCADPWLRDVPLDHKWIPGIIFDEKIKARVFHDDLVKKKWGRTLKWAKKKNNWVFLNES